MDAAGSVGTYSRTSILIRTLCHSGMVLHVANVHVGMLLLVNTGSENTMKANGHGCMITSITMRTGYHLSRAGRLCIDAPTVATVGAIIA